MKNIWCWIHIETTFTQKLQIHFMNNYTEIASNTMDFIDYIKNCKKEKVF